VRKASRKRTKAKPGSLARPAQQLRFHLNSHPHILTDRHQRCPPRRRPTPRRGLSIFIEELFRWVASAGAPPSLSRH
jgi:hypothetical protein